MILAVAFRSIFINLRFRMVDFEFVGQIETLSEPQLNIVKKTLLDRGIKDGKVEIEAVGQLGDNYVAIVKRITVHKDGVPFKMIAKVAPVHDMLRQLMKIDIMFRNEIIVYTKILPTFVKLFDDAKVPQKQRYRMPECYGYISEAPNEIILLEDLQLSGFSILDRLKPMSSESIELVLKDLAIFHSMSYVLKQRIPEQYEYFKNTLQNIWADMDSVKETEEWLKQLEEDTLLVIDDEKYRQFLRGIITRFTDVISKVHQRDIVSKYSVIQQGDCWTNNIMFRLEDNHPIEACMIDYQLAKPSTPVSDIFYLTFNCTNYETRAKNWRKWLDLYHEELNNSLSNFNLDVKRIYPRSELEADLKRNSNLALALTVFLSNVLIRKSDEIMVFPAMENLEDLHEAGKSYRVVNMREDTQQIFKDRIKGCIDSLTDFNYL